MGRLLRDARGQFAGSRPGFSGLFSGLAQTLQEEAVPTPGPQFARRDVPIGDFGIDHVSAGEEHHLRKFHDETRHSGVEQVPLARIRAGQGTVDFDPAHQRSASTDAAEPVRGKPLPDGRIQLMDGHHRLVEAKLRGDSHLAVQHVGYGSGHCLLPHCDYGYPTKQR